MSSNADAANAAYQAAVDGTVGKPSTVRRGSLRLGNIRKPFEGTPDQLTESDRAQLTAIFGSERSLDAAFGPSKTATHEDFILRNAQFVDVIDVETNTAVNRAVLYPYGHGAIFHSNKTTFPATIVQHGLNRAKGTGKAWVSDFARAWLIDSGPLGLWTGHIIFSDDELGERDDDE